MLAKPFPVIDFHNDLLYYLTYKEGRGADDAKSLSSISQFKGGQIKLQVLAIPAMTTADSVNLGKKQVAAYKNLVAKNYEVKTLPAIENASAFASEDEPIQTSLARLEEFMTDTGPLVYISLTWNGENRFGGGSSSLAGLKEDGKHLLRFLNGRHIAVDFSHASDRLAFDTLNYIDKENLKIPVMASHSNFRSVLDMERNLPDDLAKELIKRKGVIGLNLFAPFIGASFEKLLEHIHYGLSLGGEQALSFGGDFFCVEDFPHIKEKYPGKTLFFKELPNPSCYPYLFSLMKEKLSLSDAVLNKISHENAVNFLKGSLLQNLQGF